MPEKSGISESEWKVMEALWQQPGASLSQVVDALSATGWSYSTIKTLLGRLVAKGHVTAQRQGKNYNYFPGSENDCRAEAAHNFLSRVFGGSVSALVASLAKQENLSEQEKTELQNLINNMEE